MSEYSHRHEISCVSIEDLLVRRCYDQITESEQVLVRRHLLSCECCSAFKRTLTSIPQTVAQSCRADVQPDPAIREHVRSRMQTIHQNRPGRLWHSLMHHVVTIRVPVYQIVIGIAAMLLITLVGMNEQISSDLMLDSGRSGNVFADTTATHLNSGLGQLDLMDTLQVRRTVQKDSLLSKYYRGMYDTLLTDRLPGRL